MKDTDKVTLTVGQLKRLVNESWFGLVNKDKTDEKLINGFFNEEVYVAAFLKDFGCTLLDYKQKEAKFDNQPWNPKEYNTSGIFETPNGDKIHWYTGLTGMEYAPAYVVFEQVPPIKPRIFNPRNIKEFKQQVVNGYGKIRSW